VISELSEGNLKWGGDRLNAVKGRALGRSGMWSVYKSSEVEWSVGVGEMCVIECSIVWFTHCLVYLVVFNTDLSTLGSIRFGVLIGYVFLIFFFFCNFAYWVLFWVLCVIFCDMCYCILLYRTVLYCPVFHCSTLPAGINPFSVNNNNNNNNNNAKFEECVYCVRQNTYYVFM